MIETFHIHSPAMDTDTPGGVYLCQVNDQVSCGACCGLYNVADTSAANLNALLQTRSLLFADMPRTATAIDDFAHRVQALEPRRRPFPDFHHCPFIGLIGPRRSRVGCLLHPLAEGNQGVDYRGLSFYGGLACRTYFCPATHQLAARYKQILRYVITDWHLYGLIITETKLLDALFRRLDAMLPEPVAIAMFEQFPDAGRHLIEVLRLKLDWPFRPRYADSACHYFFTDPPYCKPSLDYRPLGMAPSHYTEIFEELISQFDSARDVTIAEQLVQDRLAALAKSLRAWG